MTPQNITFILGTLFVVVGIGFIYWPAALIAAGIFAIVGAFTSEWEG